MNPLQSPVQSPNYSVVVLFDGVNYTVYKIDKSTIITFEPLHGHSLPELIGTATDAAGAGTIAGQVAYT